MGLISIQDLPWDSKIFNIPMASITEFIVDPDKGAKYEIGKTLLEKAIYWARQNRYKFLLCKTYSDDIKNIHILENQGFSLVDTLLDYVVDFRKTPFEKIPIQSSSEDITIRYALPDDEYELALLAKDSFQNHFGRYHSDPHFSKEQAIEVYAEWMRSSLHGYADYFVVAEIEGRIAGLSIWKKSTEKKKLFQRK